MGFFIFILMVSLIPPFYCHIPPPQLIDTAIPKQSSINETLSLKKLIDSIDIKPRKSMNVNELCNIYGVKRRGFYDFLSIASLFNICRRISNDSFEWIGFKDVQNIINEIYIETRSNNNINLTDDFSCSSNSSLQNISLNVIKLFSYLGVKFLDLRQVAKLFSIGGAKYKTMLRKLYTVATGLELAGIICKTNKVAEIKLLYKISNLKKQINSIKSLTLILNTEEELVEESIFENRRKSFNDLTKDPRNYIFSISDILTPDKGYLSRILN